MYLLASVCSLGSACRLQPLQLSETTSLAGVQITGEQDLLLTVIVIWLMILVLFVLVLCDYKSRKRKELDARLVQEYEDRKLWNKIHLLSDDELLNIKHQMDAGKVFDNHYPLVQEIKRRKLHLK